MFAGFVGVVVSLESGQTQSIKKAGSGRPKVWLAGLVAVVLPISLVAPAQALATQDDSGGQFERIESSGTDGYVVQLEPEVELTDVLDDATESVDLSGPAFDGAVADLNPNEVVQLEQDPRVVAVEPNQTLTINQAGGQRQPLTGTGSAVGGSGEIGANANTTVWGLDRADQRKRPLDQQYSPASSGAGVDVYVVDSGVDLNHRQFGGRTGKSAFIGSAGDSALDCNGHGTHVAGIAASQDYGIASGATVHSVRVLNCEGSGTLVDTIDGLNWVGDNAEPHSIVNLSLGGSKSVALNKAVANLVAAGIPVVAASGNEAQVACNTSPASASSAITVGALDESDREANFSNYGTCVDLYAPGVAITSLTANQPTTATTWSGTSMAAPHVAGALAVAWSQNPARTSQQIGDSVLTDATSGVIAFPYGQAGSPDKNLFIEPAAASPAPPAVTKPPTAKRVSVKARAIAKRSKLRLNVNPNQRSWNYKFKVQKKIRGKWKTIKVTRTRGRADVRTLNLRRGKYRVVVPRQHGLRGRVSNVIWLRR